MWRFSAGPLPLEERLVLCSIIHDITDRLKSEKALARSKNEWEKTFDAMSDIITIQDENMHIVRANKAAHRLFHASPGELNGRYCYEVFRGAAGPCQGCPLVETSEDTGYHTNIMKHENLGKIFQVSSNLIPSENGDPPRLLHIARDITAQKQLEEELFQSHKMEAIGTLAGGIAHDFNNILADPTNAHQIVVNLCTNAYQAMANEKGALRVALSREVLRARAITAGGVAAGPFIVLSVSDTGQGMDQKTIKQIFDPFFTTKPLGKGTGLGLAVIAGIKAYLRKPVDLTKIARLVRSMLDGK
jgi:PAS domain S-box-containing protein